MSDRVIPFHMSPRSGTCHQAFERDEVMQAVRNIFPNWTTFRSPTLAKGAQWWTLSFNAVSKVRGVIFDFPDLILRIGFSWIPEEAFVQTIMQFLDLASNGEKRYVKWDGGMHPVTLTVGDVEAMHNGSFLFARKLALGDVNVSRVSEDFIARETGVLPATLQEDVILGIKQ
jgi:hypothetical protein